MGLSPGELREYPGNLPCFELFALLSSATLVPATAVHAPMSAKNPLLFEIYLIRFPCCGISTSRASIEVIHLHTQEETLVINDLPPPDRIEVGQRASHSRTISEEDVAQFARSTGDMNPFHVNEQYAKHTRFGRRIAHGMLVTGLISAVMGMKLPGPGTIYLHQELDFRHPVYIGDTVTAVVEVLEVRKDQPIVMLSTRCYNQDNILVVEGKAVVMVDRMPTS